MINKLIKLNKILVGNIESDMRKFVGLTPDLLWYINSIQKQQKWVKKWIFILNPWQMRTLNEISEAVHNLTVVKKDKYEDYFKS